MTKVSLEINGKRVEKEIPDHTLLSTFLRENLNLTGTHVGCDTSQCGACVIHLDGVSIKACTMLAKQAEGSDITTIEGLANGDELHPMQQAFHENHGLQCGFCTPGMVMSAIEMVTKNKNISEDEIREGLEGNICRCTGYHNIVESVKGPQGGYRNKNKTSDISLNKFFEVLEGPTAIMDCYFESGCNHLSSCNIKTPIKKINDSVRDLFNNITLADIS